MKVLHINDIFTPYGGAETYFHEVSNSLKRWGIEVFQFSMDVTDPPHDSNAALFKESQGLRFRQIQEHSFNPGLFANLQNYIKEIRPDVIHLHNTQKYPLTVLSAVTVNKKAPVVQSIHDYSPICPRVWNVRRNGTPCQLWLGLGCMECLSSKYAPRIPLLAMRKLLSRKLDAFFVASRDMELRMKKGGYRNLYVNPYFIDYDNYEYAPSKKEGSRVLHVARLGRHKGTRYLVQAMSYVVQKVPAAKLHIIGGGPEEPNLRALAGSLKLDDSIVFRGFLWDDKQLKEEYQKANLLVIPSIWMENTPLVAFQSLASGRPVIGSRIGGVAELVREGTEGFLVNTRDPKQIAEKIVAILQDRELAKRMEVNARKRSESFGREEHIARIMEVYQRVANTA